MQKRIECNRKVMELLWKLERKKVFAQQFNSAQEYLEWSLKNAEQWFRKYPYKELKRYVDV